MSNTKFGMEMVKDYTKIKTVQGFVYSGISLIPN